MHRLPCSWISSLSLLFCCLISFAPPQLHAQPVLEKRVALVIGIEAYGSPEKDLPNAVRDARVMKDKLTALGFDVIYKENLKVKEAPATLALFKSRLAPGAVALMYYSGHGMQVAGRNFLILQLPDERHGEPTVAELRGISLVVDDLIALLRDANTQCNILLLDACRESIRGVRATGLSEIAAPVGTVVGFATYPGGYSYDLAGVDDNSLYTKYLGMDLLKANVTIEQMLKGVGKSVFEYSKKNAQPGEKPQQPWMQSSLYEDVFLNSIAPKKLLGNEKGDTELWYTVKDSKEPGSISGYLHSYPNGQFVPQAKQRLTTLQQPAAVPSMLVSLEKKKGVERLMNSPVFLDEIDAYLKESSDPMSELTAGIARGDLLAKAWWCALATHERYRIGTRAEKEVRYCQEVESSRYPIGKFLMGRAYLFGRGVAADPRKGRELLDKAVKAGNAVAQNLMGDLFFEGGVFPVDAAKAVKLYQSAAAAGNYHAENNLGVAYLLGRGVTQDPYDARAWFRKAAAKGDPWAQLNLGALFLTGDGGIGDTDEGYLWISKSADQGNAQAWLMLAKIYEEGVGRDIDRSQAAAWYKRVVQESADPELAGAAKTALKRMGL